jgi:hypothetical protein
MSPRARASARVRRVTGRDLFGAPRSCVHIIFDFDSAAGCARRSQRHPVGVAFESTQMLHYLSAGSDIPGGVRLSSVPVHGRPVATGVLASVTPRRWAPSCSEGIIRASARTESRSPRHSGFRGGRRALCRATLPIRAMGPASPAAAGRGRAAAGRGRRGGLPCSTSASGASRAGYSIPPVTRSGRRSLADETSSSRSSGFPRLPGRIDRGLVRSGA